jgi:hypothetical protein
MQALRFLLSLLYHFTAMAPPRQPTPRNKLTSGPACAIKNSALGLGGLLPHMRHATENKQGNLADRNSILQRHIGMSQLM